MRVILLSLFVFCCHVQAFEVPRLTGPVVDEAKIISPKAQAAIGNLLKDLKNKTGTQLQVLTLPELGDLSIEEVAIKVFDNWQLGSKKEDKGLLMLIALKERKTRIEVGQGLEGDLPDVIAKRIIDQVMIPQFRSGDYEAGIWLGLVSIVQRVEPDYDLGKIAVGSSDRSKIKDLKNYEVLFFIIMMMIMGFLGRFGPRGFRSRHGWGAAGGGYWGGGGFGGGGGGWGGGGGGSSGGGASGGW